MPAQRPAQAQRPRISYLTTAYQSERFLPETIASVLAQTDPDWELVVVDNGNAEPIAEIVRRHSADPRISLVRQENRGYRGGVSAAAAAARGRYLCVLDSDDRLAPEHAAVIGSFIDEHPGVDAVGCDAHQFYDGESAPFGGGYFRSLGKRRAPAQGRRLRAADVLEGWVPYYSSAIRRGAWDQVGGYEPGIYGVDESVVIWLRLAESFDVRLIPDKLAFYRVRSDSLSRDPEKVESFEDRLIRSFEGYAAESMDVRSELAVVRTVRKIRYLRALRQARWAFQAGDIAQARVRAREAWGYRHTPRAAAALAATTVAPRLATAIYPLKQRAPAVIRRTRQQLSSRLAGSR